MTIPRTPPDVWHRIRLWDGTEWEARDIGPTQGTGRSDSHQHRWLQLRPPPDTEEVNE